MAVTETRFLHTDCSDGGGGQAPQGERGPPTGIMYVRMVLMSLVGVRGR